MLFLGLFVCAVFANAQSTLTDAENGKTIVVSPSQKGETLTISLKASGGTPYQWKMASNNEAVLAFEKETSHKPAENNMGDVPMVGGGYFADFIFHYTGATGSSNLSFNLVSFSGEIAKTVTYTINIAEEVPSFPPINLSEENNGTTLALSTAEKGNLVNVSLSNQSGTPFQWQREDNNENIVAFQKEGSHVLNEDEQMTGGAYTTDYQYKITGVKGTTKLVFKLVSFSGEIAKTIEYTFVVK